MFSNFWLIMSRQFRCCLSVTDVSLISEVYEQVVGSTDFLIILTFVEIKLLGI